MLPSLAPAFVLVTLPIFGGADASAAGRATQAGRRERRVTLSRLHGSGRLERRVRRYRPPRPGGSRAAVTRRGTAPPPPRWRSADLHKPARRWRHWPAAARGTARCSAPRSSRRPRTPGSRRTCQTGRRSPPLTRWRWRPATPGCWCCGRGRAPASARFAEAIADLDQAIAADPKLADAYVFRASALRQEGALDSAAADLDKALALDPRHPEALLERGIIRGLKGDDTGARADWRTLVDADPKTPAAEQARRNLEQIDSRK